MNAVFNHLLQSTAFALLIAVAAALLRRNSPRLRYWLWLAASLKFLIPFSLLVATGSRIQLPPDTPSLHAVTVQQISNYFAPVAADPARTAIPWMDGLIAIWLFGVIFLLIRWFRNWRETKTAALEPGVAGIFRPMLMLPEGIAEVLTGEQLQAVVAHEERHIECFDNLTAALHMVVETLFWFHPLVWWIGARLMDERERDCDEAVLRRGSQPGAYARSIVQVCETYIESPLACTSGISGSDLKKRIREIMTWRGSLPVTKTGKTMLAVVAVAAVSLPFALGILRAQTLPPAPTYTYDVVSIHKSDPAANGTQIGEGPQGGLRTINTSLMLLMTMAYDVRNYQIIGAPAWVSSEHFDISFTPDRPERPPAPGMSLKEMDAYQSRNNQRLQAIFRDRFGLVLRAEEHDLPIYLLTQSKGGSKLTLHPDSEPGPSMQMNRGQLTARGATVKMLIMPLAQDLGRPVVDNTGLTGRYDFKLSWTPGLDSATQAGSASGESIFTAVADQLGLRLESAKGPVPVYVVEKVEHPTEN